MVGYHILFLKLELFWEGPLAIDWYLQVPADGVNPLGLSTLRKIIDRLIRCLSLSLCLSLTNSHSFSHSEGTMGLLSSKTLIQAHAIFLFILAVYLTKSPEVVTDSDVVLMLGEVLQIVRMTQKSLDIPATARTTFRHPRKQTPRRQLTSNENKRMYLQRSRGLNPPSPYVASSWWPMPSLTSSSSPRCHI